MRSKLTKKSIFFDEKLIARAHNFLHVLIIFSLVNFASRFQSLSTSWYQYTVLVLVLLLLCTLHILHTQQHTKSALFVWQLQSVLHSGDVVSVVLGCSALSRGWYRLRFAAFLVAANPGFGRVLIRVEVGSLIAPMKAPASIMSPHT